MQETEHGAWVERLVSGFIAESPENTLASDEKEKKWDQINDPMYKSCFIVIGIIFI